jgi:hypothetical protein
MFRWSSVEGQASGSNERYLFFTDVNRQVNNLIDINDFIVIDFETLKTERERKTAERTILLLL